MKKGWLKISKDDVTKQKKESSAIKNVQYEMQKEFTIFYEQYFEKVFRYVRAMRFPFNHTNDLVSKIFEKCWERFHEFISFDESRQNIFWVMRIAENVCNYEKRRLWKRGEILIEGVQELENFLSYSRATQLTEKSVEDEFLRKELLQHFLESVLALPLRQKEVMLLRLEGMTFAEISGVLGISDEACRRRLMRAIKSFKKNISKELLLDKDGNLDLILLWYDRYNNNG